MWIRVDKDRCMGSGLCVEIAPHVFRLDDDGYAELAVDDRDVQRWSEAAEAAARQCPTNAIEIGDARSA